MRESSVNGCPAVCGGSSVIGHRSSVIENTANCQPPHSRDTPPTANRYSAIQEIRIKFAVLNQQLCPSRTVSGGVWRVSRISREQRKLFISTRRSEH